MAFKASKDAISAREAKLFLNGEEIGYAKSFEATVEKEKVELKTLGSKWTGQKTIGLSGSGTISMLKVTSKFAKMIKEYELTGQDIYFTMQGVNNDPASRAGEQRVTLFDCNINSATLATFDIDGEVLEEEVEFTFEGFTIDKAHNEKF